MADPVCTQLPGGTYRTSLGPGRFLTIETVDQSRIFVGTQVDESEGVDVDNPTWASYEKALNGFVEFEMEPDCSLKITDYKSQQVWRSMFVVLSDYMGQYVGIHGLVGKYDAQQDSVVLGGWLALPRNE